jgi:hypothetical protein
MKVKIMCPATDAAYRKMLKLFATWFFIFKICGWFYIYILRRHR